MDDQQVILDARARARARYNARANRDWEARSHRRAMFILTEIVKVLGIVASFTFAMCLLLCFLNYYLVSSFTAETACIEVLLFCTYIFLKEREPSTPLAFTSLQTAWFLGLYYVERPYTTSFLMTIVLIIDPWKMIIWQENLFCARLLANCLGYVFGSYDSLYIKMLVVSLACGYIARCENKRKSDVLLFMILGCVLRTYFNDLFSVKWLLRSQ